MKPIAYVGIYEELLSENSNAGFIVDSEHLDTILYHLGTKKIFTPSLLGRKPRFSPLKERIISEYIGFAVNDNSFMFHSINKFVVRCVESGLSNYIMSRYQVLKNYSDDVEPKVLTLEHLSAGFCVWLACIAVACIAFFMEICFKKISTIIPAGILHPFI